MARLLEVVCVPYVVHCIHLSARVRVLQLWRVRDQMLQRELEVVGLRIARWRQVGSRHHRPDDGDSESCVRQAMMTSQIIHAAPRASANTIAVDMVCENPSEPTTQPCTK